VLSFGEEAKVVKPKRMAKRISQKLLLTLSKKPIIMGGVPEATVNSINCQQESG